MSPELYIGLWATGIFFALVGVIWRLKEAESVRNTAQFDKLHERLDKAVSQSHLDAAMSRNNDDIFHRIRTISDRQDRDTNSFKEEMNRVNNALTDMRRDISAGNTSIMQSLQEMALRLRSKDNE